MSESVTVEEALKELRNKYPSHAIRVRVEVTTWNGGSSDFFSLDAPDYHSWSIESFGELLRDWKESQS